MPCLGVLQKQQALSELADEPKEQDTPEQASSLSKRRGAKRGYQGHGRKTPNLPEIEVIHDVSAEQGCCVDCGEPFASTRLRRKTSNSSLGLASGLLGYGIFTV